MKNNFGVDRSLLSGSHRIIKHTYDIPFILMLGSAFLLAKSSNFSQSQIMME